MCHLMTSSMYCSISRHVGLFGAPFRLAAVPPSCSKSYTKTGSKSEKQMPTREPKMKYKQTRV